MRKPLSVIVSDGDVCYQLIASRQQRKGLENGRWFRKRGEKLCKTGVVFSKGTRALSTLKEALPDFDIHLL